MVKAGEAYGIFYCGKDAEAVQAELPSAFKAAKVPEGFVTRLTEGLDALVAPQLVPIAVKSRQANLNYVLAASCPGLDNNRTARELADVLTMLHTSSLYQRGERFKAEVVYYNGERYVTVD